MHAKQATLPHVINSNTVTSIVHVQQGTCRMQQLDKGITNTPSQALLGAHTL
jgi:hypothetical protein